MCHKPFACYKTITVAKTDHVFYDQSYLSVSIFCKVCKVSQTQNIKA